MLSRLCLAVVLSLLPLVSLQSQSETKSPDQAEVTEAARLAVQVAELYKQGKYKEAVPLAKRCLHIRAKAFTPADEALRTALHNLAELYMRLGEFDEAAPLFQRLIKSYEEFAPADARLAGVLQGMGTVKFYTGEHGKTENLYRRALDITEKAYPPDSPKVATAASYLAEYYQAVGDLNKAEPLYQRIFAITEKQTPSGDSEDFRIARDRYACVLHKMGQEDRAQELEKLPPPGASSSPVTGSVINGKAISLPKPGYPAEARAARVSGTVVVRLVIDERGKVLRACAIKGPPLLMRASELAAYKAIFSPTKLSGKPVKVTGIVTYNFVAR